MNGLDGADGVGISDIRIDESGSFLFTLTDGRVVNAGVSPENNAQAEALAALQARLGELEGQQQSYRTLAYLGLILACISLAWQLISLIIELARKKETKIAV